VASGEGGILARLRERLAALLENPPGEARAAYGELKVARIARLPVELWVVIGREADYLVIRGTYCSCPHFQIRVLGMQVVEPCYHMVAVELAARTGRYHDLSETLTPSQVSDIVMEIMAGARSTTLRRALYRLGWGEGFRGSRRGSLTG
jgi:predicted nucleic acid-binding Zn finger protein